MLNPNQLKLLRQPRPESGNDGSPAIYHMTRGFGKPRFSQTSKDFTARRTGAKTARPTSATAPINAAPLMPAGRLDLDVDAGGQAQLIERLDRLGRRLNDVDHPLVSA